MVRDALVHPQDQGETNKEIRHKPVDRSYRDKRQILANQFVQRSTLEVGVCCGSPSPKGDDKPHETPKAPGKQYRTQTAIEVTCGVSPREPLPHQIPGYQEEGNRSKLHHLYQDDLQIAGR